MYQGRLEIWQTQYNIWQQDDSSSFLKRKNLLVVGCGVCYVGLVRDVCVPHQ